MLSEDFNLHPWCFNILINYSFLYNKDFLMFNESNYTSTILHQNNKNLNLMDSNALKKEHI